LANSAKLVSISGGYSYEPLLKPITRCARSAIPGRIQR
jgi:hypothetical protein